MWVNRYLDSPAHRQSRIQAANYSFVHYLSVIDVLRRVAAEWLLTSRREILPWCNRISSVIYTLSCNLRGNYTLIVTCTICSECFAHSSFTQILAQRLWEKHFHWTLRIMFVNNMCYHRTCLASNKIVVIMVIVSVINTFT